MFGSGFGMENISDPGSGINHPGSATLFERIDIPRILLANCFFLNILLPECPDRPRAP
jgi:hypothetical protein